MRKKKYFTSLLFSFYFTACESSPQANIDENKIIVENFVNEYPLAVKFVQEVKEDEIIRFLQKQFTKYLDENSATLGDATQKIKEIESLFLFTTYDFHRDLFPLTKEKILERGEDFGMFKEVLKDVRSSQFQELDEGKKFVISCTIYDYCGLEFQTCYHSTRKEIFTKIEKLKIKNEDQNYLIEQKIKKALKENVQPS